MSGLRSGQLARAVGVNQQTLRYYERRGLLAAPHRTAGGHRLYPPETVTVLRLIKAAQRLGFSLREVADVLEVGRHRHRHRHRPGSGLQYLAAAKLAEIEAKIAELSVIADTLRSALDAGCSDLTDCAKQPKCPLPLGDLADVGPLGLRECGRLARPGHVGQGDCPPTVIDHVGDQADPAELSAPDV